MTHSSCEGACQHAPLERTAIDSKLSLTTGSFEIKKKAMLHDMAAFYQFSHHAV